MKEIFICLKLKKVDTFGSNIKRQKEQTRYIFETNTLGITTENASIDDIMETVNHFRCVDYIIDHATDKITEAHQTNLELLQHSNHVPHHTHALCQLLHFP